MQLIHTIASLAARHGGPSRSTAGLATALSLRGAEVRLVFGSRQGDAAVLPGAGVATVPIPAGSALERLTFPLRLGRALDAEIRTSRPDILHDHGAWLPSNSLAALAGWRHGVPLVVSTRGMFSSWALQHRGAKKNVAWKVYQRRTLERAALLHVTSITEASDLRATGLRTPVAVVPNGVELPPVAPGARPRRVLFLGRLHPIKGIPLLLEAWSRVRPAGWVLELAGPDVDGHGEQLRDLTVRLGIADSVELTGSVGDGEKWHHYAAADLFVMPSLSENFGIAVAEALAAEVPVITTTATPWPFVGPAGAGWCVDPGVEELTGALTAALQLPWQERRAMGRRGRRLIEERFSWPAAAESLLQAYAWVLGRGEMPACVQQG